MKQKLLILFALLLIGISSKVQAYAFSMLYNGKTIYYSIKSSNTLEVTSNGGISYTGIISIPYSVTYQGHTYSVTSIGTLAFYGCSGLTSVTIPNSVTSIESSAFEGCIGLTSITIPNSVTSIGDYAFKGCSGLISVTIPNSVTSIGNGAFIHCDGLTTVTIPNSVTSIGDYSFYDCDGLTSVTISNSVKSIGIRTFSNCGGLTSLSVDAGNTKYSSVNGVLFNKSVDTIVCYPKGKNGNYTIASSVTSIGSDAFFSCSGLTSITIPNSVTSIGSSAFQYCSGLTSITIPNSVTSIGSSAFQYCSGLTSITIPSSVTSIGSSVFQYCIGLTSITIPNSVTSIGVSAFGSCTKLNSLKIGTSVSSIGQGAFRQCGKLTLVTLPNSVTSIGNYSFYDCANLSTIICKSINPPSISSNTLNFSQSNLSIYVPCSSKLNYMSAPYWNIYSNYFGVIDSNRYISASICKGQFYSQYGFNVDSAGIYIRKIQGINGCDSLVVLNISEYQSYSKIIKDTICQGQIYSQNGFYADSTGQYIIHHQTINGCDSIITLKLVVSQNNDTINASICQGQIYSQNGFYADSTGQYIIHHQTINGCDSIITLNLVVNKKYNDTIYTSICQGQVYTQYGFNTSYAGIYQKNMQTINGCDSIITLNLTVNSQTAPSNFAVTKINNNFELTWQGNDSIYMVYRNDSLLSIVTNNLYRDTNLIDGKLYCYKIKAKNGLCESNFSNLVCKSFSSLDDEITSNISIRIYPNPAKTNIIIDNSNYNSLNNYNIQIYNALGQMVYSNSINQQIFNIDISKWQNKGLYNVRIIDSTNKTIMAKKIVVQ